MPKLPPAYLRDARLIAKAADKVVEAGRGDSNMIRAARVLADRIRAFLTRWQNQPGVASHGNLLATFREQLLGVERRIEILHVSTLAELLEYRKCRLHAYVALEKIHRLADMVENATPEEIAQIQRYHKESQKKEFHPESAIAEQTAEVARQDADCKRLLDEYKRDWPDRLDDPHYLAILDLKLEDHQSLVEELHLMKTSLG